MNYRQLNNREKIFQIKSKVLRKIIKLIERDKQNPEVIAMILSAPDKIALAQYLPSNFDIKISDNPPIETMTFFPLGKGADLSESFCFVAYEDRKVAGWAWIHKGLRKDAPFPEIGLSIDNILWFGPDFVNPKYRGKSLQKGLVHERLKFVKENFSRETKIATIIGVENYPSLKTYKWFGFKELNKQEHI